MKSKSIKIVLLGAVLTSMLYGSFNSKRSGCETGTEILMSEVLELRAAPSTFSTLCYSL